MAPAMWADAVTRLGRLCGTGGEAESDAVLLRRFALTRDPAAFRALLARHGPLVWGVAVRHAADRHAAEDAFQATFLALTRVAGRPHANPSLAGWLHTVAARIARRTRRRPRPQADAPEPAAPAADPLDALSARELLAVLDEEIGRLPDRYRQPVLLCYLEGLSRDEAAVRLGWSAGSVKGRLERGRELLRKRLAARGVGLPAVLAALAVTPPVVTGSLQAATADAAARFAAGDGSGTAAELAAEVVRSAARRRWGSILTAVWAAAVVAGGVGLAIPTASPTPAGDPPKEPAPPAKPADADPDGPLVRVLANGKPAAGAKVWTFPEYYDVKGKPPPEPPPVVVGADGSVRLPAKVFTDGSLASAVFVFARDSAGRIGCYRHYTFRPVEPEIVIHLVETTRLTGRLTDPDGTPLPGVGVTAGPFVLPAGDQGEDKRENHRAKILLPPWEAGRAVAMSDADGRFALPGVPAGHLTVLKVRAVGRGLTLAVVRIGQPVALTPPKAGSIRVKFTGDGTAADTKGMSWHASTRQDRPTGARHNNELGWSEPPPGGPSVLASYASGTFDGSAEGVIPDLIPGTYTLTCTGGGAVPVLPKNPDNVVVKSGETAEVTVSLTKLTRVTGRVLDADTGKPIPGVRVWVYPPSRPPGYPNISGVTTDADGRYVGYYPLGFVITATILQPPAGYLKPEAKPGEYPTPAVGLTAAGHTFPDLKLRKSASFTATVVDADGKPVPATVYPALVNFNGPIAVAVTAEADGSFTVPHLDPQDLIAPRARKGDAVNVPAAVETGGKDKPVRITISKANACRVAGRVTDARGNPVAGATVHVYWNYTGVGKSGSYGTAWSVEVLTTGADGRYRSAGLWPTDRYNVSVTAPGYGKGESAQVLGVAGKTHEIADVRLVRANLTVRGVVVDLAGKPVAGAAVFNRGDGEQDLETTTDADGRFTLTGFRDAPGSGYVLARADGRRTAAVPADPGGEPVRVVLRKTTDPPDALPPAPGHADAVNRVTRHLLEALWAERARLDGFERSVFDGMARFDPATARKWADEAKGEFPARLAKAEQRRTLPGVAKGDPEEAIAQLADRKGRDGYEAVYDLARRLRPTDRKKAARVAEEAVVRARALDMPERAWALAQAGLLAARCGNVAGGKAVVAEAAGMAEILPIDGLNGSIHGSVAAYLAPFDWPRAEKMLAAHEEPGNYNRCLALAIDKTAVFDPKAAAGLLGKFRPGNSFDQYEGRLYLAYRLAEANPDEAARLVAGVTEPNYRTLGYVALARMVARTDRPRAWKLIDAALGQLDKDPDGFESWANFGGPSAMAAIVAAAARDVGHPDPTAGVVLALSRRPTEHRSGWPEHRQRQVVQIALALSFADPAAARRVLAEVAAPEDVARRAVTAERNWLFVAALVDPDHAPAVIDQRLKHFLGRGNGRRGVSDSGLIELVHVLTAEDRFRQLTGYASLPRMNSEWEE